MGSKIILFFTALVIWLLLTWPIDAQHLVVGIIVSAMVAFLTGDLYFRGPKNGRSSIPLQRPRALARGASFVQRTHLFRHPQRYLWFLYYIPLFIWECLKANLDVAYRVTHPELPINPGIVKVKTVLKSDTALTFLANSITLTPGTMCVDIDKEKGILYIHWIDVKSKDIQKASELIVQNFEGVLKKIFE